MYDPVKAFFFIIFLVGLQQIETNIIYPKIVGDSIGLPGLIVLACVTVGGGLGGVAGLLISVPVTSVVYTLIKEFVDVTLEKKRLEKERLLALEAERAATEEQAATHEASVGEASAETPASDTPAN
jgi:predicted PurR-regulated permease PerM